MAPQPGNASKCVFLGLLMKSDESKLTDGAVYAIDAVITVVEEAGLAARWHKYTALQYQHDTWYVARVCAFQVK